ncbi:hypothetical protein AGMMS49975_11230 [Clostridia bacterium]|nr:hypothetical protein AGMMS49975_11230 [Clostridia bacterium]
MELDVMSFVENSANPVVVKFGGEWCAPCKQVGAMLEDLKTKHYFDLLEVDVGTYASVANRFSVSTLPTLLVYRKGEPVKRFEGVVSAQTIERLLTA